MVNVLCHIKYDTLCHKVILYIICLLDVHVHKNLYECQSRHLFLIFIYLTLFRKVIENLI